ncbi:hypothetical protein CPB83DRAFT_864057 [Crepidotus variabilis]|uniref:Uncharacterized protein n=1 Tax=Crepidotus variabilis TaxID=179855 RepID=A0A9P6JIW7_9AGAR|nr:hypothetical protein CPB83DRAFT_864057 [Crepidotus variabilis]
MVYHGARPPSTRRNPAGLAIWVLTLPTGSGTTVSQSQPLGFVYPTWTRTTTGQLSFDKETLEVIDDKHITNLPGQSKDVRARCGY